MLSGSDSESSKYKVGEVKMIGDEQSFPENQKKPLFKEGDRVLFIHNGFADQITIKEKVFLLLRFKEVVAILGDKNNG